MLTDGSDDDDDDCHLSVTGHHGWGMCRELSSVPPTLAAVSVCQRTPQSVFTYSQGAQETPELRGVVEYGTCSTN